jgi:hypothetical protein
VYGLNAAGEAVVEVTSGVGEVEWRVHLANRKAAWYQFLNAMDLGTHALPARRRNEAIRGADRVQLLIDPGPRSVRGPNAGGAAAHRFDTGAFFGTPVYLGELRTDEAGRLLVLGGRGHSAPLDPRMRPTTFANNDFWHDDTADGPVRATVRVGDQTFEAEPAMVAVAPPNYGPGLAGVVTLYDLVYDLYCRTPRFGMTTPTRPSFWRDLNPLFERLVRLQWVNDGFHFLFGPGSPGNLTDPGLLATLADPGSAAAPIRRALFERFREPGESRPEPEKLPSFYGDGYSEVLESDPDDAGSAWLPVTPTQYAWLSAWADGDFDPNPALALGPPAPLESLPLAAQPSALDRAYLEDCLGGPFHPGIELTWTLRSERMWRTAFRLNVLPEGLSPPEDFGEVLQPAVAVAPGGVLDASGPGTLTRWLGVPWQTDEASCLAGYELGTYLPMPSFWAARVPNHVLSERAYERVRDITLPAAQRRKHFDNRQEWLRFFGPSYLRRIADNVRGWARVGVVAERPGPADHAATGLPERLWVETEIDPRLVAADPTWRALLAAEGATPPLMATTAPLAPAAPGASAGPPHERRQLRRDEL